MNKSNERQAEISLERSRCSLELALKTSRGSQLSLTGVLTVHIISHISNTVDECTNENTFESVIFQE